jgi:hypothetical protein
LPGSKLPPLAGGLPVETLAEGLPELLAGLHAATTSTTTAPRSAVDRIMKVTSW